MQHEDTLAALQFAGIPLHDAWARYRSLGGGLDLLWFSAWLYGMSTPDAEATELIPRAVNDLIDARCPPELTQFCRAPSSRVLIQADGTYPRT